MSDPNSIDDEFLVESTELLEGIARDLLLLDADQKDGRFDPELLNAVFRRMHTLKGIAGMFGFVDLSELAHSLEDLLDQLRLGRLPLAGGSMDLLFEGVELLQRLLAGGTAEARSHDIDGLREAIARALTALSQTTPDLGAHHVDPEILAVLTEYEEHRLNANLAAGITLYRLKIGFPLSSIDSDLEALKQRAKGFAEIITYLPSLDGDDVERVELEVLLASDMPVGELEATLVGTEDAVLTPLFVPPPAAPSDEVSEVPLPTARLSGRPPARLSESPSSTSLKAAKPPSTGVRSASKTVRVDIEKLDLLMNVVGELAIVRNGIEKLLERVRETPELSGLERDLHLLNRQFERRVDDLREGVLDVRMVPLGQTFGRLARALRQTAREHQRDVRLAVTGAETEVDKLIVEELTDPLLHIVRNAIDHGIETTNAREARGKPRTGTLALNAYQKGKHVVIEIEDDGAGMDDVRIVESAIACGAIDATVAAELPKSERLSLIFLPGVSTANELSELSGRGVGMDVVKTHIARLGGVIDIESELGVGTKFTITLPVTLAIINTLVVETAGRSFCLPLTTVQEALVLNPATIHRVEGREVITMRGASLPLCRLDQFFGLATAGASPKKEFVVVARLGQRKLGLVVHRLEGQRDIIIKPLGPSLDHVSGFAGATDLGDQRVVLVIDISALLEETLSVRDRTDVAAGTAPRLMS